MICKPISFRRIILLELYAWGTIALLLISYLLWSFASLSKNSFSFNQSIKPVMTALNESKIQSFIRPVAPALHLEEIAQKLILVGVNGKESITPSDPLLIATADGKQWQLLTPGERKYLTFGDKGLKFSPTNTPLWFKIKPAGSGWVLDLSLWLPIGKQEKVIKSHLQTVLYPISSAETKKVIAEVDPISTDAIQKLKSSIFRTPDRLIELYGGAAYNNVRGKYRLETAVPNQRQVLLFDRNDHLIWQEGTWQLGSSNDALIADLRVITDQKLECVVWGKYGFSQQTIALQSKKETALIKFEEMINRARLRTPKQVSCRLGKKNLLLHVGDWILREEDHWHRITSLKDLDALLAYQKKGDLFVLDQIEKKGPQYILKGHLFDPDRVQAREVSFPLVQKKANPAVLSKPSSPQVRKYSPAHEEEDADEEGYIQLMDEVKEHETHRH